MLTKCGQTTYLNVALQGQTQLMKYLQSTVMPHSGKRLIIKHNKTEEGMWLNKDFIGIENHMYQVNIFYIRKYS